MIRSLYDKFKNWYCTNGETNNTIYFYSDPHFGDLESYLFRNNITIIKKGEKNLYDMNHILVTEERIMDYVRKFDEMQIKNINSKVNWGDTIVFLGDIGDIECVKKIRGYKILVLGNHDKGASYYKEIFDEVYEGALMISDKIILSHEPIDPLPSFMYNIHGHEHGTLKLNRERHLNVCAEHINYTPICISDVIKSGVLKNVADIHREVINRRINILNEQNKTN